MEDRMYHIYKLSVALIIATCMQSTLSMDTTYTPQNTQFAFDFHDVVVKPAANRISQGLFNRNFLYSIHLNRYLPALVWSIALLSYHGGTGEQYIKLLQDYQQPTVAQLALDIANNQLPIPGTVAIIKQLKALGYEVNMASDIGALALKDFGKKELGKPEQDQILPLFIHKHHVNYIEAFKPIKKPNPAYFAAYQQQYNPSHKPHVIFIDDKLKNVTGAREAGMISILFTSAAQLEEQLIKMGILPQH
jgi:beta-phosphoglucomutase-like phosphatase (HAD superfamily)